MSCRRRGKLRGATSPATALSRQQQSDATPRPLVLDFERQYTVFTLVLSCSIPVSTALARKRAESRIRALKATVHTENERSRVPPDTCDYPRRLGNSLYVYLVASTFFSFSGPLRPSVTPSADFTQTHGRTCGGDRRHEQSDQQGVYGVSDTSYIS